jgi:hypothetical protein
MNREELEREEARTLAEYNERYRPRPYQKAFFSPPGGQWKVDASYVDSFFESAKFFLEHIVEGSLPEPMYGVPAVYLCRHYLELEIKYALFHSRWLTHEHKNTKESEIEAVENIHSLHELWRTLIEELKRRVPSIFDTGLDLKFVAAFVAEIHGVDKEGWRFRYPRSHIAVAPRTKQPADVLGIDYASLLFDLKRAREILNTLDGRLVDQHGENDEWKNGLESF